ncbi:MAG: hypothetical protein ACFB10_26160 [Salibacteraceae bacterium]
MSSFSGKFSGLKTCSLLVIISVVIGCTSKDGCTDCFATNYNPDANKDDGNCTYLSDPYLGQWEMIDSTVDNFLTPFIDTYNIQITAGDPNKNHLQFSRLPGGYDNLVALFGDSLCTLDESLHCEGGQGTYNGYFITQDSFYLKVSWLTPTFGDAYYAVLRGKRL